MFMFRKVFISTPKLFKRHYGQKAREKVLSDKHGRFHDYLRISLSERCNLRCLYCMPEEGVQLTQKSKLLTSEEICKVSDIFVRLGVKKIRFTGGEPLVRSDVVNLIERVNVLKSSGLEKIFLTTNGITLSSKIKLLVKAGLNGVNISLDTLIPSKYELITRRKGFERVWRSIHDCLETGLEFTKINCVVIRGINDEELCDFVRLTETMPVDIRFIEYMPFGGNKWDVKKMVSFHEMMSRIKDKNFELISVENEHNSTSKMYKLKSGIGRVGFITSNTVNFCGTCNRLRITADGSLKVCLHGVSEISLRDAIRSGLGDDDLGKIISGAINNKAAKHAGMMELSKSKNRPMILIGG